MDNELKNAFAEAMDRIENKQEQYWNSLTKDQQLDVFCSVVRRICQAQEEERSYRGTLYSVFGFGAEAYMQAQMAGYLEIHNNLWSADHERDMLEAFCAVNKIENADKLIHNFIVGEVTQNGR